MSSGSAAVVAQARTARRTRGQPCRVGGQPLLQRRRQEPGGDERDVVGLVAVGEDLVQEQRRQVLRRLGAVPADRLGEPVQAGVDRRVPPLDESVGVEQEDRSRLDRGGALA